MIAPAKQSPWARKQQPARPTKPGKLLLVGSFVSGDAYASVGLELAARLTGAGWPVRCTSSHRNPVRRLADMLSTCWRYRNSYDVAYVEIYSGRAFLWADVVCSFLRWLGKPYIAALHGGNLPRYAVRNRRRVSRLVSGAAAVVCPSPYLFDAFAADRPDLRIIPNAIDLSGYPTRVRNKPAPCLVWLRAFRHLYAPEIAIGVLAAVRQRFPDARLTLIGPDRQDGTHRRTQALVESLGLTAHVDFIPGVPKDQVGLRLSDGDIFLNTSRVDNTPVSVIEAMACGLCVVSSSVGGVPRLITDGQDGLLVPPDDVGAMAAAVLRILDEPALAERLSANAIHKARDCDWSAVVPLWDALLSGIIRTNLR